MSAIISSGNSIFNTSAGSVALFEGSSGFINVEGGAHVISAVNAAAAIFVGDIFSATTHQITVDGAVMSFGTGGGSSGDGIVVGLNAAAAITVNKTGTLYGHFNAIDALGQTDVFNNGSITSNSGDPTIRMGQSNGTSSWDSFIFNFETGSIKNDSGVAIAYDSNGTHTLNNSGVISAGDGFFTVWGVNNSVEKITNTGIFTSGVTLGQGNDVVNTKFGRIDGTSELGSGNDRYIGSNTAIDTVFGDDGADILLGNGGNDVLSGGSGNDKLTGGAGADTMTSGSGFNTFIFTALSDSTVAGTGRDTITDFSSPSDDFDVSAIDANAVAVGNNAFTAFIGAAAFTGLGQIRAVQVGTNTLVQFNTTGSTAADMAILLENVTATTVNLSDFIL
jgi:serralysin